MITAIGSCGTFWPPHRGGHGGVDTVPTKVMGSLGEQIRFLLLLRDCPKAGAHLNVLGHFGGNRSYFAISNHSCTRN